MRTAGVAMMIALYGGKAGDNLGDMRYAAFLKMVKQRGGRFQPERLPPSQPAAELHALRVHLQVVVWASLGEEKPDPTLWGWLEKKREI